MKGWTPRSETASWTAALVVGMVLAFGWAWSRGGDAPDRRTAEEDPRGSVRDAVAMIRSEATQVETRIHRDSWARELGPRAVADHLDGEILSMGWPKDRALSGPEQDSIRAALFQPDLARITEEDVAIGLYVVEHGPSVGRGPDPASIIGVHDGIPYCVRVVSFDRRRVLPGHFLRWARRRHADPEAAADLTGPYRSDLLSGCTFVHRFGMPGDGVRAWLGARSGAYTADWMPTNLFSARDATERASDPLDVGSVLVGAYTKYGVNVVQRSCLAGERRQCMREFFPTLTEPPPPGATTVVEATPASWIVEIGSDLLGEIEADFGPEAFMEFWTSEATFEEAFTSAFGLHPGEWAHRQAARRDGTIRAGPGPAVGAAGTSTILVLIGLCVGLVTAVRRRAG